MIVHRPQNQGQRFPREPNFCAYINEIAFGIMQEEKIPVVDTYWMTLSRPDHREVVEKETIRTSYKLVHLGVSALWHGCVSPAWERGVSKYVCVAFFCRLSPVVGVVQDEVYLFLVRKWVHMIFEAIEKGQTGVPYL